MNKLVELLTWVQWSLPHHEHTCDVTYIPTYKSYLVLHFNAVRRVELST